MADEGSDHSGLGFGLGRFGGGLSGGGDDPEAVKRVLLMAQQVDQGAKSFTLLQVSSQIASVCYEQCVDAPSYRTSKKERSCVERCASQLLQTNLQLQQLSQITN